MINQQALTKPSISLKIGPTQIQIDPETRRILLSRQGAGWVSEEVATFGESDVFIRRDAEGSARLFVKAVRLSVAMKELANVGGKDNPAYIITVPGYNRLNQIAGIHTITPPSITDDGTEHPNPYVQYKDGEIKRVIARKIAIGYSPTGNLVAIDTTRHYNFDAYYLQDLQKKAKYKPDAAKFGTAFSCPFAPEAEVANQRGSVYVKTQEGRVYVFKVIKDVEGIWIDMSHPEMQDVYSQHIQHQKFGDTIAQNLATRNALKAHPAIASSQVTLKDGMADVLVYGFRHEKSMDDMKKLGEQIIRGEQIQGVTVQADTSEATLDEVETATETEVDESVSAPSEGSLFAGNGNPTDIPPEKPKVLSIPPGQITDEIRNAAKEKGINLEVFTKNMLETRFENLSADQEVRLLKTLKALPVKRSTPLGEPPKKGGVK